MVIMKKFKKNFLKNRSVFFNKKGQVLRSKDFIFNSILKFHKFLIMRGL